MKKTYLSYKSSSSPMPPKIIKPKARRSNESASGKVRANKGKRSSGGLSSAKIGDPPENVEVPESILKEESWLDRLPPVIKPDAELHKTLSYRRRAAERRKHEVYALEEINCILDYALDIAGTKDYRELRRARVKYHNGGYYNPLPVPNMNEIPEINLPKIDISDFDPLKLIALNQMPMNDAYTEVGTIMSQSKRRPLKYDWNREVDSIIAKAAEAGSLYSDDRGVIERAPFPYVCVVVGPPCSGKTTIAQFIQRYYRVNIIKVTPGDVPELPQILKDVHVVQSTDDKRLIADIVSIISEIKSEQDGIVLVGFPNTKSQLSGLVKGLSNQSKKDSKAPAINFMIRVDVPTTSCEEFAKERMFDTNSGLVISEKFFPSGYYGYPFEKNVNIEKIPRVIEPSFHKIYSNVSSIEKLLRKDNVPCLEVAHCEFVSELHTQVFEFISRFLEVNNSDIPTYFERRYNSLQEYKYSRFCFNLMQSWENEIKPIFGRELCRLYSNFRSMNSVIESLSRTIKEQFMLRLNIADDRSRVKSSRDVKYFNYIWELSSRARDNALSSISSFVDDRLKIDVIYKEDTTYDAFSSLMNRFLVIGWFVSTYKYYVLNPEILPIDIVNIKLPEHDGSFESIASNVAECLSKVYTADSPEIPRSKSTQLEECNADVTLPMIIHSSSLNDIGCETSAGHNDLDIDCKIPSINSEKRVKLLPVFPETKNTKTIKKFLDWLLRITKDYNFSEESRVVSGLFNYFRKQNVRLNEILKETSVSLKREISYLVSKKYKIEMEDFSRRFLDQSVLPRFLSNFSTLPDHLINSVSILQGRIPDPNNVPTFPTNLICKLFNALDKANGSLITIEELLREAAVAGFTDEDVATLELYTRMICHPDIIDYRRLLCMIHPQITRDEVIYKALNRPKTTPLVSL